ncbi:MAG: DNA adenine methylase [bacterium]
MVSPFLRWAGSKRQHVPLLRQYWCAAQHKRYIEPFAGSAALFFAVAPPRAVLGDLNGELIQTYRALSRDPEAVYRKLTRFAKGEAAYYRFRAMRRSDAKWLAARFIYLNRFCFNGLYRTNFRGEFNVPYGAPKNDRLPDLDHLAACAQLLSRARLVRADFRRPLAMVEPGDFVYMDPPYAVSRRRVFVEYGKEPFSTDDLIDLATWLEEIDRRGASFVLSYADSHEARSLFRGWENRRFAVRRNVAGFSGARRNHYELFVSNMKEF